MVARKKCAGCGCNKGTRTEYRHEHYLFYKLIGGGVLVDHDDRGPAAAVVLVAPRHGVGVGAGSVVVAGAGLLLLLVLRGRAAAEDPTTMNETQTTC